MLIGARVHTTATYFAFALLAGVLLWQSSQYPQPIIEYRSAATEEHGAGRYTEEEKKKTDEALARYTGWLTFFTGILAFATIGLGVATLGMYSLARAEFLSTHRPKIRFKHVWLLSGFKHDTPIVGHVTCWNTGTSDAFIFEYGIKFSVIETGKRLPVPSEFQKVETGIRLPPGVSLPFPNVTCALKEGDDTAIREGKSRLFLAGYLIYRDGIGRFRTTAFCRVMPQPGSPEDTGRLTVFNDPDYEYED